MTMLAIQTRNVNGALAQGVFNFYQHIATPFTRIVSPRGMPTMEWSGPVVTYFDRPRERVLFSPTRDANPFMHFFGSLWMLAGRNDLAFLTTFTKRFAEFSDDGETLSGAYGWRWRTAWWDQLDGLITLFREDPETRRAVLTMWGTSELVRKKRSKDVPCNTHVYFKLRDGELDMTVCCRSNDMLWGAYGTDSVDFSTLQEYLADKLEVNVGRHVHLSDSFHVYLPPHPGGALWEKLIASREEPPVPASPFRDPYELGQVNPFPLAVEPAWDEDLHRFFRCFDDAGGLCEGHSNNTMFFEQVVWPMWRAWRSRKQPDVALKIIESCLASDWRLACSEWIKRRIK
jgi:hypothetical protein